MTEFEKINTNGNAPGHYDLRSEETRDNALRKIGTAGSLSISAELFEKIYLSPKNRVHGDLRSIIGNPTPLGIFGFIISLTPLTADLMGWRGAGGGGAALVGVFFGMGGFLMPVAGILEFILGNTFPAVVFFSFGAFWLSFGFTLTPFYNATAAYDPSNPANPGFNASYAFLFVCMGIMCFIYLICGIRTNIVFEIIFLFLMLGFVLLAGAYWQLAELNASLATKLQVAGGATLFVACMAGWYLFFVQMLASVDFPYTLPVGDLSGRIKGRSERLAAV